MTPAQRLVALADLELAMLADGRLDELDQLDAAREAALSALEAAGATAADRPSLAHAAASQALAGAAMREALTRTGADLARLGHARTAARGYRAATGA